MDEEFFDEKKTEIEHTVDDQVFDIEFNLSSIEKKVIENVCEKFTIYAKDIIKDMKGVTRLPTKKGIIITRKSPCGEGTNSWAKYRIFVYPRKFKISATNSELEKLANFLKSTNVDISLTIKGSQ